ncbi:hypothetical protein M0805_000530 [Coniferiporia weirii]|nr:hypothetical protein M0805_000530 [Coniferiporia weirii]
MTISSVESHPPLDGTFGCLFLAVFLQRRFLWYSPKRVILHQYIGYSLWGSGSVQLYNYYDPVQNYGKTDRWWLKLHIFLLYALDTVQQILTLFSLYTYFVKDFGNFEGLSKLDRPIVVSTIISAIVCALAQSLFVIRVWHLSRNNRPLTAVLAFFATCQFVATTTYFTKIYDFTKIAQLSSAIASECIMNSVVTFTDISITAVLAFLLRSLRSGMKQSDSLMKRLIIYTICTGLTSSVGALVALVTAVVLPHLFVYLIADIVIAKLYTNSVLALLNSRQRLREDYADNVQHRLDLNSIHSPSTGTNATIHRLFSVPNRPGEITDKVGPEWMAITEA